MHSIHGLDAYRFELDGCMMRSAKVCPQNAVIFADEYDMAINLTSILGGPVFNTKTHMYNMQPPMYERITVLNAEGHLQLPNSWDESYISVEPISGASLQTVLNLQGVLLFEKDLLFKKIVDPVMIPFFSVYRSGNFTEDQVNDLLGDLKTGLTIKTVALFTGTILGGILLIAFGYFLVNAIQLSKKLKEMSGANQDQESLLRSNFS